jgi:hypothetical protein
MTLLRGNGALGAWLYNNWLHDNQDNFLEASEASTLSDTLPDLVSVDDEASMNETSDALEVSVNEASGLLTYALSSDEKVSVNETSVVSEASVNEVSVISKVSVNEASGSLTTVVSGDAEAANGQPPLFFFVYVTNAKSASKSPAISERAPLMKAVPIGAQRTFVTETDKQKRAKEGWKVDQEAFPIWTQKLSACS